MSANSPKRFLQGLIAWILLLLYAGTAIAMLIAVVRCGGSGSCTTVAFHDGLLFVVTSIGALVSALVVATLAKAPPGGEIEIAGATTASRGDRFSHRMPWIYLGVWLLIGTAAVVVGVLMYPEVNQSVSDLGTAWLGTAITAAYAYFGIEAPGAAGRPSTQGSASGS